MASETNQSVFDVNVYFVLLNKYENYEECDEITLDAYAKCSDWDIQPIWITEIECLTLKPDKKDVFIIEEFEGQAFEALQRFKCTIIGPRCLISCFLSGEPIPEGSKPVFNTAMRGFIVSASGFSGAIKNEIEKKVEYMGGIFTKQLRASVTHLVTNIVMSAKYEHAVELGIKVTTIDWVRSVWEKNLQDFVSGNDEIFNKYKCPVFLNLVATSTNLSRRQKDEIKLLINNNGGEFMGPLDGTKIKIVITSETGSVSEKLKFALQNNIPCLKMEWVYDSVAAGYSLPFSNYVIKTSQACSTPEKSTAPEPFNFSTISVIPGENHNVCVDETLVSMSSTVMGRTLSSDKMPAPSKITYTTVLDRLNTAEVKKAGPFLDGCNIYLAGFSSNYRDKLNRILNVGSATRLDDISEALTHVIVGDPLKATHDLRIIKSKGLCPYILKVEWLEECIKLQAPAPEDNFLFDGKDSTNQVAPEPPSPLSKKSLQLLQRPKIPAAPLFDDDKNESKKVPDEHSDIVQQYLENTTSEPDCALREILKLPSADNIGNNLNLVKNQSGLERWNDTSMKDNNTTSFNPESRDDSAIPISQDTFVSQKILQGLVFIINGFEDDEYTQLVTQIHGLGGKIIKRNYSSIPDYGIVPKFGAELKHTVGEIVTDLFIEDCIDNEKLMEVLYYHRPIILPKTIKPLANCVIGMSTYCGAERIYLSKLSEALGARYQDTFARKTNIQKNTYSSTHLICPKPQGEKYNAAVKWKLPAVTCEWLLTCAAELKLVDETSYLVGETMAPERSSITINEAINDETNAKSPTQPTPIREKLIYSALNSGPTSETPIVNKRLNNLINEKTPQSPFHVSTPETPYGQIFKENPSPRTRKGWVKWINHFPDVPTEEPPSKKRRSTPLSDVKRLAWDFVTGRLDSELSEADVDKKSKESDVNVETKEPDEIINKHIITNRKLSFSDSPERTARNPAISLQIAQLDEMLLKASNTPEARQSSSSSIDCANPFPLEPDPNAPNCLVKESQPDSVGWEDPVKRVPPSRRSVINEEPIDLEDIISIQDDDFPEELIVVEKEMQKPKFMFTGIKGKALIVAEKLITEIGGEISHESSFDPSVTHLICVKPARNEKLLSSIASGKWVLHYLYIEACNNEKKFVNEEEYELGNPKSIGVIPEGNTENENMIMRAAHRWRLKLLKDPGGAFQNMVALLITPKERKEQFERLIQAGGGIVVEAKPPYDNSPRGKKITHCFIQLKQIDQQVDWAMMASKGIMCFPPQFLNDHLMSESPLNLRDCVLPEFQKYLALMPVSKM